MFLLVHQIQLMMESSSDTAVTQRNAPRTCANGVVSAMQGTRASSRKAYTRARNVRVAGKLARLNVPEEQNVRAVLRVAHGAVEDGAMLGGAVLDRDVGAHCCKRRAEGERSGREDSKLQEILGNPRFERGLSRVVPRDAGHRQARLYVCTLCPDTGAARLELPTTFPRGGDRPSRRLFLASTRHWHPGHKHTCIWHSRVMQAVKIRTSPAGDGCRTRRRAANGEAGWVATSNQQAARGMRVEQLEHSTTRPQHGSLSGCGTAGREAHADPRFPAPSGRVCRGWLQVARRYC